MFLRIVKTITQPLFVFFVANESAWLLWACLPWVSQYFPECSVFTDEMSKNQYALLRTIKEESYVVLWVSHTLEFPETSLTLFKSLLLLLYIQLVDSSKQVIYIIKMRQFTIIFLTLSFVYLSEAGFRCFFGDSACSLGCKILGQKTGLCDDDNKCW